MSLPIKEIRKLTDTNAHGEAYALAARALDLSEIAEKLDAINIQHQKIGFLTWNLSNQRGLLFNEMLAAAKAKLSAEDYEALYKSF